MSTGRLQLLPPVPARGYRDLRRWVHSFLTQHPVAEVDPDDVALVLIELARNAIRHAPAGPVDIELDDDAGVLLARVSDHSAARAGHRTIDHRTRTDRGPVLVAGLSSDWGVHRRPGGGTTVWCEFWPVEPGSAVRRPAVRARAASQR